MEVRDGFIVGIFNYCDRWCERCAFTSHCRLFANHARVEASLDPSLKAIADAPLLPEEVPPPPPAWLQELLADANEACRNPPSDEEWKRIQPRVPPQHEAIDERAKDYAVRTFQWLRATENQSAGAQGSARDVISWFHMIIATKTDRALTIWPGDDEDDEFDNDGSAKVALLAIDESHAAWLDLVEQDVVTRAEADSFIADLVWLGEALERVRPKARAFVRPGFDEPAAVARLLAGEDWG